MRGRVGWGGGGARVWACMFALCSPRGPFLCLSLTPPFSLACLAFFFFFSGGGSGWGALRGCGCVPVSAPGSQGAGPGGADGQWLAAVVAWRLRRWLRLLVSVWVAWPGVGLRVGVFVAWAPTDLTETSTRLESEGPSSVTGGAETEYNGTTDWNGLSLPT